MKVNSEVVVTAVNAAGVSPNSPEVSAEPQAAQSTSAQVIQAAENFCTAIGQPVTATPTAIFPAPIFDTYGPEPYWLPRWHVVFPGQAELDVVDGTLLTSWYENYSMLSMTTPAGTAEAQSAAVQTATAAIAASGQSTSELDTPTTLEMQSNYPPTEGEHYLQVDFPREYQGIDYLDQFALIDIQAETGQVYMFSLHFTASAPTADTQTVTAADAVATANARLAAWGLSGASCSAVLSVVEPNTFYQTGGSDIPTPGPSHVVWNCTYSYSDATGYAHEALVWVDGQSGSVIGGDDQSVAGGAPLLQFGGARQHAVKRQGPSIKTRWRRSAKAQHKKHKHFRHHHSARNR